MTSEQKKPETTNSVNAFTPCIVDGSLKEESVGKYGTEFSNIVPQICSTHKVDPVLTKFDNFIGYLEICYNRHLGIILTPEMFQYTVMCELARLIKKEPKMFTEILTDKKDGDPKEKLVVTTSTPGVFESDQFMKLVAKRAPFDISKWLVKFSTSTAESAVAMQAAILDGMQVYYTYHQSFCGIYAVWMLGKHEDWRDLASIFMDMAKVMKAGKAVVVSDWLKGCAEAVLRMVANVDKKEHWKQMFSISECMSGHGGYINGWINRFWYDHYKPNDKKEWVGERGKYPSHISTVPYTADVLDGTTKSYNFYAGLIYGKMVRPEGVAKDSNRYLLPKFAYAGIEQVQLGITVKWDDSSSDSLSLEAFREAGLHSFNKYFGGGGPTIEEVD